MRRFKLPIVAAVSAGASHCPEGPKNYLNLMVAWTTTCPKQFASTKETKKCKAVKPPKKPPPRAPSTAAIDKGKGKLPGESFKCQSQFSEEPLLHPLQERQPIPGKATIQVEYARSMSSTCSGCLGPIASAELRIGIQLPADTGEFQVVRWRHVSCMKQFLRMYGGADAVTQGGLACAQGSGFGVLKPADRRLVAEVLGVECFKNERDEAEFDEQRELLDKVKGILNDIAPKPLTDVFCACLPRVKHPEGSSTPQTQSGYAPNKEAKCRVIADALVFGKLPACSVCSINSWLSASSLGYRCNGHIDEFTKCTFTSADAKIRRSKLDLRAVNIPPGPLKQLEALKIPANAGRVLLTGLTSLITDCSETKNPREAIQPPDHRTLPQQTLFEGFTFILYSACLTDVKQWAATVREHGGVAVEISSSFSAENASFAASIQASHGPAPMILVDSEAAYGKIESSSSSDFKKNHDEVCRRARVVTVLWMKLALQWNQIPHPLSLPRTTGSSTLQIDTSLMLPQNAPVLDEKEIKRSTDIQAKKKASEDAASTPPDQKAAESTTKKKVVFRGSIPVDSECSAQLPSTGEVLIDSTTGVPYSFSLASADVVSNTNKFYIAQIVKDMSNTLYLFRRWGRVGDGVRNDVILRPMDERRATSEFEKLFFEKTGNAWVDAQRGFTKKPGKMVLVETEKAAFTDVSSASSAIGSPCVLHRNTVQLIQKLFDTDVMQSAMMEMSIDVKKLPVGSLRLSTIERGRNLLQDALSIIESKAKEPQRSSKLTSLTNQFYSCIPHAFDDKAKGLSDLLLDTKEKIAVKYALLEDLKDIALTQQIVTSNSTALDPVTANYHSLQLKSLDYLDSSHKECQLVEKYLTNTHGRTHSKFKLLHVWKLQRNGEAERYNPQGLGNRKLLWHGSRLTNWVRILQQGLRIAPPEAPSTGYMFGKGVYFADMFTKSANYCHFGTKGQNTGLLALAEVALGTPTERTRSDYITTLPSGTNSCFAKGEDMPNPKHDEPWIGDTSVTVPCGKPVKQYVSGSLLYNEFIVYDVSQIRLHYLLEVAPN